MSDYGLGDGSEYVPSETTTDYSPSGTTDTQVPPALISPSITGDVTPMHTTIDDTEHLAAEALAREIPGYSHIPDYSAAAEAALSSIDSTPTTSLGPDTTTSSTTSTDPIAASLSTTSPSATLPPTTTPSTTIPSTTIPSTTSTTTVLTKASFYSATPAKNKYLELIGQLLSMDPAKPYLKVDLASDLCNDVQQALTEEKSLIHLDVAEGETLVVVGDVHGQYADLVKHILSQQYDRPYGKPERRFLFLGDFVDRGPHGVDVVMLLFALKVEYPSLIFMLRGNHEENQTSRIYGFLFECKQKFNDASIFTTFNNTFTALPLAAKIATPKRTIFAAHGGLSPQLTSADDVLKIRRMEYGAGLEPRFEAIVDGLLWSDPTEDTRLFERNDRGCGYLFGPDATSHFLNNSQVDLVVRAHQLTAEGYCYTHQGRTLTVFSAPNYCGVNDNKGALLLVSDELDFVQYTTASSGGVAPLPVTMPWSQLFF